MDNSVLLVEGSSLKRRKFIVNTLKSAGGLALLSLNPSLMSSSHFSFKKAYKVQEIIDIILKEGGLLKLEKTVDSIKFGDPSQSVTGIVTTMFPTVTVIEEAAKRKANFIIAHEPSFYNHLDDLDWVKDNAVLKQKQQLLEKHKMVIWRFHDYCHSLKPDAITYGVVKKANWLSYYKPEESIITIPTLSLEQLVKHLKKSLNISTVKVIGEPFQKCERLALLPGAWGGQNQVSFVEKEKPDVLIVGESPEWETVEYIRDSLLLGGKTSLIILGHAVSEEPGMEWLAEWLQPKIVDVKISHIPSGDPFGWL